jgi:hypothetical protein
MVKRSQWTIFGLGIALIVATPTWLPLAPLPVKPFGIDEISQVLSLLFVISLLLERSLEIFVTTWRDPDELALTFALNEAKAALTACQEADPPHPDALDAALAQVRTCQKERSRYRAETTRIALWSALILGLLISASGVRSLTILVDIEQAQPFQTIMVELVDVLLTGGLIAGGSDGVHKLLQVVTNFLDSTSDRVKQNSPK